MAVAVKNPPVSAPANPFDRMAVVSLVGAAYVLGSLGIVFGVVPYLWATSISGLGEFTNAVLLGLAMLVVATGLAILGVRLIGPKQPAGARAGIFAGLVIFVIALLLTRWVSLWMEYWVRTKAVSGTVGIAVTVGVGLALVALEIYLFLRPETEKYLVLLEGQGWFTAHSYKGLQGQRVRRGTILGLLLMAGSGVYTMMNNGTLNRLPPKWSLNIPFTGMVKVENEGDAGPILASVPAQGKDPLRLDLYTFQDVNERLDREYVRVADPGLTGLTRNSVMTREEFDKVANEPTYKGIEGAQPVAGPPVHAAGPVSYQYLTLLPTLKYTLPLLLLAASLWLAWRVVNFPPFADFLIATEAELNKVSWTTRPRLIQDTIVVLVTVFLMAMFLFLMDQTWHFVLSWKPIGVLQIPDDTSDKNKSAEQKNW